MQYPHFRIYPTSDGWTWNTLDSQGQVTGQGAARSRKAAAACVILNVVRSQTDAPLRRLDRAA